ncbi:MAG: hypothetical protein IKF14_04995 [Atopobiaceae bacterium]|nr:hypothetical protein [Atopobiaceae bacterium]
MRVLIAIPTFENITPDTFKSVYDMDKGGHECLFEFVRGYDCAAARNKIAEKALELGADFLMMVDGDVTVPKDALLNLLSHDADCVSGYYLRRGKDNEPSGRTCAYKLLDDAGKPHFNYTVESAYMKDELAEIRCRGEHFVEIHGCGMGCILVRTSVFNRVKYPWFKWVNYENGPRNVLTEDLYFCEELRKAGIPRYVDTRVACGHLFRRIEEAI